MALKRIGIELTDRCDLACRHCFRQVVPPSSVTARDLDPGILRKVLAEGPALGIERINFTGGEPTLHPRFLDLLDLVADRGLRYAFVTNALELPELMPRLVDRPLRREALRGVCVSIEGATESTHDRIRGRGTFRRTLAGIAVLRAMDIPFSLQSTVTRVNRHEIEPLGLLAHNLGATRLLYTHFLPSGRLHATEDLDLTADERHEAEAVISRLAGALRLPIGMGEGYYVAIADHMCPTARLDTLNVDASGHLTFCCELSSYNGDNRPPAARADHVADLARVSLAEAVRLQEAAIQRFREARLQDERDGTRTEDDRFACRYCVRHFGKPRGDVIPLRRASIS